MFIAGLGIVIILLSCVVTTITALSMSAICTNGVVRGGKTTDHRINFTAFPPASSAGSISLSTNTAVYSGITAAGLNIIYEHIQLEITRPHPDIKSFAERMERPEDILCR